MPAQLEGGSELDGGPLSALSESYFTTNQHGSYVIAHLEGALDQNAFKEAIGYGQLKFPSLATPLEERRQGLRHYLVRKPLESLPELEVRICDFSVSDTNFLETIRQIIYSNYEKPFELFEAAPVRFFLICFSDNHYAFVVNAHHTCADGFVIVNFLQAVVEQYHYLVSGEMKYYPPKPLFAPRKSLTKVPNYRANMRSLLKDFRVRRRRPLMKRRKPIREHNGDRPYYAAVLLSTEETEYVLNKAKRLGITVNDLLNIAIIQSIDEIRGHPNALMSVCYPMNLRLYLEEQGRHANLTSGFYIDLLQDQRQTQSDLINNFVAARSRLMKQGRAYFNLVLLQKIFAALRLFPYQKRISWLRKRGGYPATFICSNLGDFKLKDDTGKTRLIGDGLAIRDWDVLFYPNKNTDYLVLALTYNDSLKLCISADHRVVKRAEAESFKKQLKCQLLQ